MTSGCKAKTEQEKPQPRYQMPVSKQLDLCFGDIGNTDCKTQEEEGKCPFLMLSRGCPWVVRCLLVCVHVCECVRAVGGLSEGIPSGTVGKRGRERGF